MLSSCWHCAQAPVNCVDLTSPVAIIHDVELSKKDYDLMKGDDGSPECTTNRELAMKYMREGGTNPVLFEELLNKPDTPQPTPDTGTTRSFSEYSVRPPPCPPRSMLSPPCACPAPLDSVPPRHARHRRARAAAAPLASPCTALRRSQALGRVTGPPTQPCGVPTSPTRSLSSRKVLSSEQLASDVFQ